MSEVLSCPKCSAIISVREGKTAKFCPKCGERVTQTAAVPKAREAPPLQKPQSAPMASPRPIASPVARPVTSPPVTRPVAPPAPVDTLAHETPEIAIRRWNWGALFLAPWWALSQRAYVAATVYLLVDGVLWSFFLLAVSSIARNITDPMYTLFTLTSCGAIVFLITMLVAIPLAIVGDAVALKQRTFRHEIEYRKVQRTWTRWGTFVALAVILPPALTAAYLLITVPHTPGGLNIRLLTAATQGNTTEIRAVLDENRKNYGVGATNLEFDNAIGNAKYSGNPEAVKLLQEEVAKRRRLEGTTNP